MSNILIDTDVLIDFLRGVPEAVDYLSNCMEKKFISCITVSELYAGVKEGRERKILENFIQLFTVLMVNETVAIQAGLLKRDYGKKNGMGLADAMIAATAQEKRCTLVTLNKKHFSMLEHIFIPYKK